MSRIRVVTDSSASIPGSMISDLKIEVVPILVTIKGETFEDGVELTSEEFFRRMRSGERASTSAPTVGRFARAYEKLIGEGASQVLCVTVPRTVSAVHNSASVAAQVLGERGASTPPVVVIDTPVGLGAQGFIVMELARRALEGATMDDLLDLAEELSSLARLFITVETVDYLVQGGRVNRLLGWIVTALNLKPIIELRKRQPLPVVRARSMRMAMELMLRFTEEQLAGASSSSVMVLHAAAPERASYMAEQLRLRVNPDCLLIQGLPPVVGAHVGPGAVAIGMLGRP